MLNSISFSNVPHPNSVDYVYSFSVIIMQPLEPPKDKLLAAECLPLAETTRTPPARYILSYIVITGLGVRRRAYVCWA